MEIKKKKKHTQKQVCWLSCKEKVSEAASLLQLCNTEKVPRWWCVNPILIFKATKTHKERKNDTFVLYMLLCRLFLMGGGGGGHVVALSNDHWPFSNDEMRVQQRRHSLQEKKDAFWFLD